MFSSVLAACVSVYVCLSAIYKKTFIHIIQKYVCGTINYTICGTINYLHI